jgi:hypothetical protein
MSVSAPAIAARMQKIPSSRENSAQMTKRTSFAITVAILIVSGIAGAMQSPSPRTPVSVKGVAVIGPDHSITPATSTSTTQIVPALVIGPAEALFLGTGDGSNGGWVDP